MDVGTMWYMFWTNSNRLKFAAIVIFSLFNKNNIIRDRFFNFCETRSSNNSKFWKVIKVGQNYFN
jgi:hypothetical protein